jgi:TetR/AcrR family transcriptional regulator, transcriptional repressor for nem operon
MSIRKASRSAKGTNRGRRETYRSARKRDTHQRILTSASSIVRREGLRAASVPRVMRGAGLTVGGFYAHFDSKAAMDIEVIKTLLGAFPGRWLSGLENSAGIDWVIRALKRYLSVEHRDNAAGCPYPAVLSEVAASPAEVRRAFVDAFSLRVHAFEANVPRVNGISARERALASMALTVGGLLLARATAGHPVSEEMLTACRKWALPEMDEKPERRSPPKGGKVALPR